jgi:hypothetical protein
MTREHWRTKLRQQQNAVGESPLYGHARRHAGRKRRVSPSPRLHRGPQKQGIFAETAAATARVSTRGHKNRDFSYRRQRRQRASPLGATKAGTFHSDGRGDGARLHRGQEKQGLFTQTATATARVSTGGNKSRDFSLDGDGARLHQSSAAALLNPGQSFTRLLRRRGCPRPRSACCL